MSPSSLSSLVSNIQALLYVNGAPLSKKVLARLVNVSRANLESALTQFKEHLANDPLSGLMLIEHDAAIELVTKKEAAPFINALTKSTREEHLSRAALEVLAIIAYRGPITRVKIEAIRGVNCSFTLRNLLLRGLIERTDNPLDAREYAYTVTFALLERLGLSTIEELPAFKELREDARLSMVLTHESDENNNAINPDTLATV